MERRQVGGGVLAGLAAAVPLIVDMSGFVLPAHAGYALLGLCFAAFVWGMWAICAPNRLWPLGPRRAKPKIISEPALKGGFTLRPDTPLAEAIRYAATGNWDGELGDLTPDGYLAALDKAITDFTELAARGSIRVFYRGYKDAPHQVLDKEAWFPHRIEIMDILDGEAIMRRRKDNSRIQTCHDLRVSREQWDANWTYLRSTLA